MTPEKTDAHRAEAKSYGFLTLWVFTDFLIVLGHVNLAIWVFGIVLWIAIGLFTHHAKRGWPNRSKLLWQIHACSCVGLAVILFLMSRPAKVEPKAGFSLIATNEVSQIMKYLSMPHPLVAVMIRPIAPDESAYQLSQQLEKIFRDGRYAPFSGAPPSSATEVPGVSCFLYGCATCDNPGLLPALSRILNATGSHNEVNLMVSDEDPWFTNSVVVIFIRKK